jgi:hypothetical protein
MAEHFYAECCLCLVSFILSATYKNYMLSVVMLNVIMVSVVALVLTMCRQLQSLIFT